MDEVKHKKQRLYSYLHISSDIKCESARHLNQKPEDWLLSEMPKPVDHHVWKTFLKSRCSKTGSVLVCSNIYE